MTFTRPEQKRQRNPPKSGITFIGDMDSVVYACGFAAQKTIREVHLDEDSGRVASFSKVDDLKDWLQEQGLENNDYVVCSRVEVDPLPFALHSVKLFVEEMLDDTNAEDYIFYLTGKNNFRDEIAVTLPYKGNRDPNGKPKLYKEIREYLINRWDAIVVDGYEADDAAIMKANELTKACKDWIVATRDKDLFQFPGKFYRY